MMRGIFVSVLILVLAGAASGAVINPTLVKQTIQVADIVPAVQTVAMTFDSSVRGATVYLDGKLAGSSEATSKTPVTINKVTVGDHSVTFKLAGYQDSVASFTVVAGRPQTIYAQLQPVVRAVAVLHAVTVEAPLHREIITMIPVTTTPASPPPTTNPIVICSADSTCMSEITARNTYGPNNYTRSSDNPCGYEKDAPNGLSMTKYCFKKKAEPLKIAIAGTPVVRKDVGTVVPELPTPPVEPAEPMKVEPAAITHIGIIDSFIGIFGGLFGKPAPQSPAFGNLTGPAIDPGVIHGLDSYRVATTIHPGATVYIGEEHLNVTSALFEISPIAGISPAGGPTVPGLAKIGWFASDPYTTSPTKMVNLGVSSRYRDLTVSPADFVGYAGTWYVLNSDGTAPVNDHATLFIVRDPSLGLSVTSAGTSVSGGTVHTGDQLRFSITKNIGVVTSSGTNLREPLTNSVNDGFMDIVVTSPSGKKLTQLDVMSGGSPAVADLSRPCWELPPDSSCNPSYTWNTGATFGNGTAKYPPGTYTVQVISKLNNMHNNYRNAGALYEGKTASQRISFTLA